MNIRHLRYALAAADHGSFRRAGQALGVDSSVLSRRVRDLEIRLGSPLFDRSPAGLKLTGAGERFVPHARNTLDQISAIFEGELMRKGREVTRYRIQMHIERCIDDGSSTPRFVTGDVSVPPMASFVIDDDSGRRIADALQGDEAGVAVRIVRAMSDISSVIDSGRDFEVSRVSATRAE